MDQAGPTTDAKAARAAAIAATIARIRRIEREHGITRPALAAIRDELLRLAAQARLFPNEAFPPPAPGERGVKRYLLQADADHRYALYLNALNPGNNTPPHDHTTWAVVVAIEGQELNRVYERTDDGSDPDRCDIRLREAIVVEPGQGICLMPDDIHSIHTQGDRPARHLHMYGLALERLDGRRTFDAHTGEVTHHRRARMALARNPCG